MVKGQQGCNASFQQAVYKPAIVIQSLIIDTAAAIGQNTGPGYGEAIPADAQGFHNGHVFRPAVIVIAGYVAC